MHDWRNPDDYNFTQALTAEQWAWEFLRRNPEYQQAWQSFIATWHELESCHGKPSQRDIRAWLQDSRAWVPAQTCLESDCRIDGDKVLIECALGARWGFYKFPPDPSDSDPVGAARLVWREVIWKMPMLNPDQQATNSSHLTTLAFDLSMPLTHQLEQAKRRLQIEQRDAVKTGRVVAPSIRKRNTMLTRYLRLLDGYSANATAQQIAEALQLTAAEYEFQQSEALRLRDQDYRQLLFLS